MMCEESRHGAGCFLKGCTPHASYRKVTFIVVAQMMIHDLVINLNEYHRVTYGSHKTKRQPQRTTALENVWKSSTICVDNSIGASYLHLQPVNASLMRKEDSSSR